MSSNSLQTMLNSIMKLSQTQMPKGNGETELANDGQGADHKHQILQQVTEDLHEGTGGYSQPDVTLEIEPKLKVGDRVLLFSFNDGQKYYVAERIEVEQE